MIILMIVSWPLQVNYCIQTYGSQDIGGVVRLILIATMSDTLMTRYNRTGRDGKQKLSPDFVRAIQSKCSKELNNARVLYMGYEICVHYI